MKPTNIGGIAVFAPRLDARPSLGRARRLLAVSILCVATIAGPTFAHAHGGGGAHGGGFHGGGFHGAGFHGGGFHGSGFHGGEFHRGEFHGRYHGWGDGGYGYCANPVGLYPSMWPCGIPW